MPNVSVYNAEGKKVRDYAFGEGFLPETPNTHVMHLHVMRQLANKRQGSASTLTRAEVRGGGKKPWKQKGTGRARAGSIRSPLWKGGGVIFGPRPRKYTMSLPTKVRRLALRSAIATQLSRLHVIEGFKLDKPSTKQLGALLSKLAPEGKVLLLVKAGDENVALSARNLAHVRLKAANNLSVKDLLSVDHVVATEEALRHIEEVFKA
ncbi:MAG TPA: 50S ribosomal protein L4 [Oscillatoriaceae cyanobacterium]